MLKQLNPEQVEVDIRQAEPLEEFNRPESERSGDVELRWQEV